jgi:anti-sigma regulatory factor (Ser/Thr protein kinase)
LIELSLRLPPDLEAPTAARRTLRALDGYLPGAALDDCELLVSELVTNCLRHAGLTDEGGWIGMSVTVSPRRVRIEVTDPGPGFAAPPLPTPHEDSGWGLELVDQLASRWGVEREGSTRVWFELEPVAP